MLRPPGVVSPAARGIPSSSARFSSYPYTPINFDYHLQDPRATPEDHAAAIRRATTRHRTDEQQKMVRKLWDHLRWDRGDVNAAVCNAYVRFLVFGDPSPELVHEACTLLQRMLSREYAPQLLDPPSPETVYLVMHGVERLPHEHKPIREVLRIQGALCDAGLLYWPVYAANFLPAASRVFAAYGRPQHAERALQTLHRHLVDSGYQYQEVFREPGFTEAGLVWAYQAVAESLVRANLTGRAQTLLGQMDERGLPKSGRLYAAVARAVLDMEKPRLQSYFRKLQRVPPTAPPPPRMEGVANGADNTDWLGLDLAVNMLEEAQASGRCYTHLGVQVRTITRFQSTFPTVNTLSKFIPHLGFPSPPTHTLTHTHKHWHLPHLL